MKKRVRRNPKDWTIIHIKTETRKKLNSKRIALGYKNIDELINKLLKQKNEKNKDL